MMLQQYNDRTDKISIPRPITIKYNVYDTNTLYYNMPKVVYLPSEVNHFMSCFIPDFRTSNLITFDEFNSVMMYRMISMMSRTHPNYDLMMQEFYRENESCKSFIEEHVYGFKTIIDNTNIKYYVDKDFNMMVVSKDMTIISTRDTNIAFNSNKDILYMCRNDSYRQFYLKSHNNTTIAYTSTKNNFKAILKTNNIDETMKINMDNMNNMFINFDYFQKDDMNVLTLTSKMVKSHNGSYYNVYKENDMNVVRSYDSKTKQCRYISQCMMTGGDGIRFRGNYSELSQDNKIIDKAIKKDDYILYNKKDEEVLVDNINSIKIRNDVMIVWKAVKTESGEWRVLKLAIPPDAMILRPIDKEYFNTYDKMRCDRAIVLDIQLPVKDEEISMVPDEKEVISCVYKNTRLKYFVGQEVTPDSYDANPDVGCSNGIHFFVDRMSVFDAYINI